MRHHRKSTVLAAAALTALSLGLTACGGSGTGAKDAGSAGAVARATTGTGDGATSADSGSGSTGGGKGTNTSTASTGSTTGGKASAEAPACAHDDVRVTAAKADEVPTEHVVLTATNVSGRACALLKHPLLAFGPIQTAKDVPAVEKSRPAVPVVVKNGESAYADVRISLGGVHEDNKVVREFTVNLFAPEGPAEGSVVVKAPAGGLAVNEAVAKTGYWTYELRNGADEF
ncbi:MULTISPECIES: DUF4232 domain-containing protein [unclassified Streptomyces]|uniref:DUF4232 domain-containing protein n=1 Tax=unclassified Streptomyces TaxID=2593676 RepID=UPI0006ADE320|nr:MULTISPECIES: DUF4232 domain-containing protein [unclassified Streptomyces]KOX36995.1 hypothetical protein ADL06_03900 [Streptomyces sp. NRRL F-6491]KOX51977.1 hypothetical protein ADL08_02855 [Streptomyces sp. NRRL F-6492]